MQIYEYVLCFCVGLVFSLLVLYVLGITKKRVIKLFLLNLMLGAGGVVSMLFWQDIDRLSVFLSGFAGGIGYLFCLIVKFFVQII